jgi:hypothetical protein
MGIFSTGKSPWYTPPVGVLFWDERLAPMSDFLNLASFQKRMPGH